MEVIQINLERSGSFRASSMVVNPNKCAAMRTKIYRYDIRIEGTNEHLSKEGFLFNNERVGQYFRQRFGEEAPSWNAISCERMAETAAEEIMNILMKDGVSVKRVCCTINGSNGARITAIFPPATPAGRAQNA